MDLLIKNGTIVTAKESFLGDIAVKDGKIVCIGVDLDMDADEVVDATGKLVLPGAIDAHTHEMRSGASRGQLPSGHQAAVRRCSTVFDVTMQKKGKALATIGE
jgi:dihydropyrimidinase